MFPSRQTETELFQYFLDLKKEQNLRYLDTHVHPVDVFGFSSPCDYHKYVGAVSLLEKMKFNRLSLHLLEQAFYWFPDYVRDRIKACYSGINQEILLSEMEKAGIDYAVLVPTGVVTTKAIADFSVAPNFLRLGTVDLHGIKIEDMEEEIKQQIKHYLIKGIKLHPNLQGFYPLPDYNSPEIRVKLLKLYELVTKHGLYVLFHGGISFIPRQKGFVRVEYARLENFLGRNGGKSVFDLILTPIILAHLGNYNVPTPNFELLHNIVEKYPHVYFDTSGINPAHIGAFIETNGIYRIVFGSDSQYFNLKHSIYLVLRVLNSVIIKESLSFRIARVFSLNFKEKILIR